MSRINNFIRIPGTSLFCAVVFLLLTALLSCNSKKDSAFDIFNEGVALALDAGKLMEEGKKDEAVRLYEKSIVKYKETLKVDSTHEAVVSSMGYSYFEIRKFDEAMKWFKKAIDIEPSFALNHQYMGLCLFNKGNVEGGEKYIRRAFELNDKDDFRDHTVGNLVQIGNLAFSFGEIYEEEGNKEQGLDYKQFGVRVLMSALEFSKNDKSVGTMLEEYADKLNDPDLKTWVKQQTDSVGVRE